MKYFMRHVFFLLGYTLLFCASYYWLESRYHSNSDYFFSLQLTLTHIYMGVMLLHLLLLLYINRKQLPQVMSSFFSKASSPYNLAVVRMVVFQQVWGFYIYNLTDNSYWADMPKEARVNLPYMGWFIQHIPINHDLYVTITIAGIVCGIMAMLGLFTRYVMLLNIPLGIYIYGVPLFFGKMFHIHIWVWFPAMLAFSRCADVLSLDSLIKKYVSRKQVTVSALPDYGIPLHFMWLQFGVIYFVSGFIKLKDCGLMWALGDSMINQIQLEWVQNYNHLPGFRIDHYPALAHTGGMLVIIFELLFPVLVFTGTGRLIAFVGGLSMHNLIDYFMYISFRDLQLTYVSFINWRSVKFFLSRVKPKPLPVFCFGRAWSSRSFRRVFITSGVIVTINFFCGLLHIHSWPFSSYPTYSSIISSTRFYIHFEPYIKNGEVLNIYDLGKKAGFRMESYSQNESLINEDILRKDTASQRKNTETLWRIWISNVPTLKQADSVRVYFRVSPIAPEHCNEIISSKYLATIKQ